MLITAIGLALAAGCSNGGNGANAGRLEKTVLTVAVVPAVDSAGFFVALDQGLFKAQGLTVNFTPVTSSEDAIASQVKGTYDITGGNYVSYIQAQQRGQANLDIFAEGSLMEPGTQGIYTLPDSPVRSLADLKGQTVAINAPDNVLFLLTASVLAEHGISPQSVHFASIPFQEMPDELSSDAVGAAVMPEPFASGDEEAQGGVPLADQTRARPRASRSRATWSPSSGRPGTRTPWPPSTPRWNRASGSRTSAAPRSSRPWSRCRPRSASPRRPRRSWPWTATRSAPGRRAAWTRSGCSAWSTSCSGS
jgi:ABC-type nitrate/sulfonate/bicarbonate transport system substrate-binding protein